MSDAVAAMRWKRVGYLGPMGVGLMASAFALSVTGSYSTSQVLRYPLPIAASSLQESLAHSRGLNGKGITVEVYPLSSEEIIALAAELKVAAV